ncbi:la protein homolog [Plodia interpunctella]|uniref:la protein homolog n=1 Tax=Plodia interpunctella TaxID=58824 RepID=UPI0023681092|nr:la protein homolog [Plodia interpunctella]
MTEAKEIQEENGQNNEKNTVPDAELESSIIRQVEYYFGDVNLPRDKFLREQVKLDDGWVPLDILTRFNRLAKLTTDTDVIAKALNNSTSGLLEVSEDNKKIRRHPEMPIPEMNEERRKDLLSRTVYAKGFPKDSTLDDLIKFLKQYEETENIIMRRYVDRQTKKRLFKGSIFVTFKTKEQAEKFLATKDVKYGETDLLLRWQEEYVNSKQEEYNNRKEEKEKKLKEKEATTKSEKEELKLPSGTILHFATDGDDKMKREHVKDALTEIGAEVAFIDFKVGDVEGWVRLVKENTAKVVFEKLTDGKLKIGDKDVTFKLVEGDEEREFLDKTAEEMVKRRKNQKNFSKQKGRNFKGKQNNRKRKADQSDGGPTAKVKAVES